MTIFQPALACAVTNETPKGLSHRFSGVNHPKCVNYVEICRTLLFGRLILLVNLICLPI